MKFLTPDQIRIFDGGQIQKVEPRWNDQVSEAPDLLCLVVETTEGRSREINCDRSDFILIPIVIRKTDQLFSISVAPSSLPAGR